MMFTSADDKKVLRDSSDLVHERCVCCNRVTPYTFADGLQDRACFFPGYGQCCEACYSRLTGNATHEKKRGVRPFFTRPPETPASAVLPCMYGENEMYFVERLGKPDHKPFYSLVKRTFDILGAVFGILLLLFPMLVTGIIVRITSAGPALFRQARVGLDGKQFTILKFRTMYVDAEKNGARWSEGDTDPRITPIGHFLRKYRLDELPQLFCILAGSMSFVGPRPELAVFYREFEKHIPGFSDRLKVKPGLTGWAQVSDRFGLSPQEKIKKDLTYIRQRSLWLDLKILCKTVKVVFFCNVKK